jgi:aconitate hydratase
MSENYPLSKIEVDGEQYYINPLSATENLSKLPFSLKVLAENMLRYEDGKTVKESDIEWFSHWDANDYKEKEIAYRPARVLMQDFTGVPAVVDLASMRDAMQELGGDPDKINPLQPAELVIDHSVQVDNYGKPDALNLNTKLEYQRNTERYQFLKWGQKAFSNFKVVPPGTGIVHQVNLEYLSRTVFVRQEGDKQIAYPDTVVGTDSHTTMVNALGVLGWGVGGIEAEAAMLGQPISMLVPKVVGVKLEGKLPEGTTATDLVLRIVEMLREHGVVGKFVEFYGEGIKELPLADRATIANMAPEYGATCGIFPVDQETLNYLRLSNRDEHQIALVEAYYRAQGMFYDDSQSDCEYNENVMLDLSTVVPSLAGPKRPQDRIALDKVQQSFQGYQQSVSSAKNSVTVSKNGNDFELKDGAVVIAAITSCTNTSNPYVMIGAGLVAQKAAKLGLSSQPWVKTSLAPGSKVVTNYLQKSCLDKSLEALGFYNVGYGCTTCIGNSGPLDKDIAKAIDDNNLVVSSVLSGNRNFEGRVHPQVKTNYLASPPLVVAYAIAGTIDIDLSKDAIGVSNEGKEVYLKDIWPTQDELNETVNKYVNREHFDKTYAEVFTGEENWVKLSANAEQQYSWPKSTYVQKSPFFSNINKGEDLVEHLKGVRVLALLGDSVTTDHISPAGAIKEDSPAGKYLQQQQVTAAQFNSYGSRRGNHEVMMRGTFANIRLRNRLLPETEGGVSVHIPSDEQMSIYDVAMRYMEEQTPVVVIAGKEYGTGSSRDWAAKGSKLLGVRVVLAESFERIHRTNLVGMGILPLQFKAGESADSLGITGYEIFDFENINKGESEEVIVRATDTDGKQKQFTVIVRIDTPQEIEYYQNGGILRYVLRQLAVA